MKILMVNKFLYPNGGSETYIFELGKELARQGHQVEYFGMEHENRIVGNRVESYTANMDFHTGKLQKLMYPFKIIYSGEARKKIRAVLRDFAPDVVHLNNFNYQLTPSIIYEIKAHKIPIVFTAHDYQLVCPNHMMINGKTGKNCEKCLHGSSIHCMKDCCIHGSRIKSLLGTMENTLYRLFRAYKKIDLIICPSSFMAGKLQEDKRLRDKCVTMHNFIPALCGAAPEKKEYVLYFGRYSKEKGVHTLLSVCKKLPEVQFIFAGKGELQEEIRKIPNIREVGFKQGEELHTLIAQAAFAVYPSEWYENGPFSVMEAQALGTPVVGADIGGIPELIAEGRTGEVFESGNADALQEKIESLWKDKEKRKAYSQNCLEYNFDNCEEYCKKLLAHYRKLTGKEKGAVSV